MNRPYDLTVAESDLIAADKWWSSLSINEMKEYRDKYATAHQWHLIPKRTIHQIWEIEGKPCPSQN